jgi:hypothetical protein
MTSRPRRFFVEVYSPDRAALRRLHSAGLDLFRTTAREAESGAFVIDGLLALDEVGDLVASGHQVLVKSDASAAEHSGGQVTEFSEWLTERER